MFRFLVVVFFWGGGWGRGVVFLYVFKIEIQQSNTKTSYGLHLLSYPLKNVNIYRERLSHCLRNGDLLHEKMKKNPTVHWGCTVTPVHCS